MRIPLICLLLLACAGPALAGAWPRARATTFLSLAQAFTTGSRPLLAPGEEITSYTSIFAEYGLTDDLTLGFDAAYGTGADTALRTGIAFARLPFWRNAGPHHFAADFGIGYRDDGTDGQDLRLRPGLAWGRGFESGWGNGWLGVEASAEWLTPSDQTILKADFTSGLKPDENWMLILQLQTGRYPDSGALIRLAPSVVRAMGDSSHLQIGLDATVLGDDSLGFKLATWFTF